MYRNDVESNITWKTQRRKADNGEGYWTSRCAEGRGNMTYAPEAGGSNYSLRIPLENDLIIIQIEVPIARFYSMSVL